MKNVILVSLFVALLLFGCSGSGSVKEAEQPTVESTTANDVSSASVTPTATPQEIKNIDAGQTGTAYEIEYLSSKYQVTLVKTAFATSEYGGNKYLLAYFEIKNTGEGSEYFTPDVYALDAESEKYDKTISMGLSSEYDKTLDFFKKLPPGTKMSGWVPIEVPKDKKEFGLYFEYTNTFIDKTPHYIKYRVTAS